MNISLYYQEYSQKKYQISNKQEEYIKTLCKLYDKCKTAENILTNFYQKNIIDLKQLNKDEVTGAIHYLTQHIEIDDTKKSIIADKYSLDTINKMLNKNYKDYHNLKLSDFLLLMKSRNKFSLVPIDHPIICEEEYEYGWQESEYCVDKKMFYLKFYSLLMIDYDSEKLSDYDSLKKNLEKYCDYYTFRIYQTFNGYHIFITSQNIYHKSEEANRIMKLLGGDIYYSLFSNKYGYKIRLSKKLGRNETYIAKYIEKIGHKEEDKQLITLLKIHDEYILKYEKNIF